MPKNNQSFADKRFNSSRNFNRIEDKYQQDSQYRSQVQKGFTSAVILRNDEGEEAIWYLKTVDPNELSGKMINEGGVKKDYLMEQRLVYFGDDQQVFIPDVELRTDDTTFGEICDGKLTIDDAIKAHSLQVKGQSSKAASMDHVFQISLKSPEKDM